MRVFGGVISFLLVSVLLQTANACRDNVDEKFVMVFHYAQKVAFNGTRVFPGYDISALVNDIVAWQFKALRFKAIASKHVLTPVEENNKFSTRCSKLPNPSHPEYDCFCELKNVKYVASYPIIYSLEMTRLQLDFLVEDLGNGVIILRIKKNIYVDFPFDYDGVRYFHDPTFNYIKNGYRTLFKALEYDVNNNFPINSPGLD